MEAAKSLALIEFVRKTGYGEAISELLTLYCDSAWKTKRKKAQEKGIMNVKAMITQLNVFIRHLFCRFLL